MNTDALMQEVKRRLEKRYNGEITVKSLSDAHEIRLKLKDWTFVKVFSDTMMRLWFLSDDDVVERLAMDFGGALEHSFICNVVRRKQ